MTQADTNNDTSRNSETRLLRVGELAKAVGKSVRAMHLYEELGLLLPVARTEGRFRLYAPDAVARITWIIKLQAIGFTLAEIQGFVHEFEDAASGREATTRVRAIFTEKLAKTRAQMKQLKVIENDLKEAIDYLDGCGQCSPLLQPVECNTCDQHSDEDRTVPPLFAGLSNTVAEGYDVSVTKLRKSSEGNS
jgi:MerR family copper efflux transcriptional regulator